jgi:hypothetical protein
MVPLLVQGALVNSYCLQTPHLRAGGACCAVTRSSTPLLMHAFSWTRACAYVDFNGGVSRDKPMAAFLMTAGETRAECDIARMNLFEGRTSAQQSPDMVWWQQLICSSTAADQMHTMPT